MMKRSILIAAVAGMAFSLASAWVWAQAPSETGRYLYGPHMWWWGGGVYGMIVGPLLMILVLAAVIGAVVLLVRWVSGPPSYHASADRTSLDILKERFARGEIDKNEFEERRRVLGV
jgi:putative membrane protein